MRFAATAAAASAAAVQEAATMQGGDKKKLEITRSRLSMSAYGPGGPGGTSSGAEEAGGGC